jgi:hypothetical protein
MIGNLRIFQAPAMLKALESGEILLLGPVTAESEDITSSITTHAIEEGATISDHVRTQPRSLSIKTVLVDKPAGISLSRAIDAVSSLLAGPTGPATVAGKKALLERWQESGELLVYSGPVQDSMTVNSFDLTLEDMAIKRISSRRRGNGIELDLGLQHIILASVKTAGAEPPAATKKTAEAGKQATQSASTGSSSILSSMFGAP